MTKLRMVAAGVALVVAALAVPGQANADPAPTAPGASAEVGVQADGNVYAWRDPYRGGGGCAWSGDDANWGDNCGDMRNRASSLENRGYTHAVNFYYNPSQGGAWACLGRGDMWLDLSIHRERFTWGSGLPGHGEPLDNNIASHRWVVSCP